MRSYSIQRGTLGCIMAVGALAAATIGSRVALADGTPNLAQAIALEHAEVSPGGAAALAPTPLESDYLAEPSAMGGQVSAESGAEPCSTCQGGDGLGLYEYNRCGCSSHQLFPYFTGPGACDNWCVGPHWDVSVDGLILFREGVDWGAIPVAAGFTRDVADQFGYGPGARIFVSGYNDSGFGMQVGYEGVNDFHASVLETNVADDRRSISYESNINSLEVNFMRRTEARWSPFLGVRYIELDDDLVDFTRTNQPVPPPADPPAPPTAFVDFGSSFYLDNRMIGLQGGVFRDVWRLNRWITLEPFANGGVYLNDLRREEITESYTTVITGDDISTPANEFSAVTTPSRTSTVREFTELGLVAEAGITGVLRLNRCVALRGGYQVLAVDGVGRGIDAFTSPGFDPTTLVYHGGHFGIEYVR